MLLKFFIAVEFIKFKKPVFAVLLQQLQLRRTRRKKSSDQSQGRGNSEETQAAGDTK